MVFSAIITFVISRRVFLKNARFYIDNAKAQASVMGKEAKLILEKAKMKSDKIVNEKMKDINNQCAKRISKLEEDEKISKDKITNSLSNIKQKENSIENKLKELNNSIQQNIKTSQDSQDSIKEAMHILENYTSFTITQAKNMLLDKVEENSKNEIAKIVKKYENEAKENAKEKVGHILAIATNKYANEYVFDSLTNIVKLPDDNIKGRIIGKDGRNIASLETLLGVDIIIDDTPDAITVSSFNTYRRAIAVEVLDILIEDGRIQPSKIEDTFELVSKKFEKNIYDEGEQIVFDLKINNMPDELIKLIGKLRYRYSYGQNALEHSLEVAKFAGAITAELGGDVKLALRAGILHDIGKSLTGDIEGSHVDLGADICRKYNEHSVVINGIYAHHDLEEALSIEAAAVCTGDTLSAARPGARREAVNTYLKRVEDIENIATSKKGVKSAYAINAGREIRVITNAEDIDDASSSILAKEIAKEISENITFPGKVKVNVIRETRSIEYAM
jgi:ribonuclease Y